MEQTVISKEDMGWLIQQPNNNMNIILSGMTALLNDNGEKMEFIENQTWYQRMIRTIIGKNKATKQEIENNHEELNVYISQAITEIYNQNCIDQQVMISLGNQLNEICQNHIQLKKILGAFILKLNEKIESIDNFHLLNTEIEQGVYSTSENSICDICKILGQLDNRCIEDERKLSIIKTSMEQQKILSDYQLSLYNYLESIINISNEDIGAVYLELSTIPNSFISNISTSVIENYHFLPDMTRKMKSKESIIEAVIFEKQLDSNITLSINEIFVELLDSKRNALAIKSENIFEHISEETSLEIVEHNPINEEYEKSKREYIRATELIMNDEIEEGVGWLKRSAKRGNAEAQHVLGSFYGYKDGDWYSAYEWFEKAANQGNAEAQYELAKIHFLGEGTIQDVDKAREWCNKAIEKNNVDAYALMAALADFDDNEEESTKWIKKAAEAGHAEAQYALSQMYFSGYGVEESLEEGFIFLKEAARQGYPGAQNELGEFYEKGTIVEVNIAMAYELYSKAAIQEDPAAQYNLANIYFYDKDFENKNMAVTYYERAAEQGHIEAQYRTGECYYNGYGVDENFNSAYEWFEKAAEQGHVEAQYQMAIAYNEGRGTERDESQAYSWLEKAAVQGLDKAQYMLGHFYIEGIGTMSNRELAYRWYEKAAEQGHREAKYVIYTRDAQLGDVRAQYQLAECYTRGYGVKYNNEKGFYWYGKAAEQGHVDAQFELGYCYNNSRGTAKNKEKAMLWYQRAAEQGNVEAKIALGYNKFKSWFSF